MRDELIRDKIVCGVTSSFVRKQLLKERDLTLDRAIEIGIVNELSDKNNTELANKAAADLKQEVHSVSKGRKTFAKEGSKPGTTQPSSSPVQRLVENAFTAASQTISKKCVVPSAQADIQALDKVLTSLVVNGQNAGIMSMKSRISRRTRPG